MFLIPRNTAENSRFTEKLEMSIVQVMSIFNGQIFNPFVPFSQSENGQE